MGKSKGKSKAKGSAKSKGKKKNKEYLLSPAQDKQLKDVIEEYRHADDSKNTKAVDAIVKKMSDKFIMDAEVEEEAEKDRIIAVWFF